MRSKVVSRIIGFLIALLWSRSVWAAPGLVQNPNPATTVVNQNTVALTSAALGSGNLLVAVVGGGSSLTVVSVTDGSNTYSQVSGSRATDTGGANWIEMWAAVNSISGPTTITATVSATSTARKEIWFFELSGMVTSSVAAAVDQVGLINNGTATTTPTGGAVTTANAADYIIGSIQSGGTVTGIHAGNAFTQPAAQITSNGDAVANLLVAATGTYTPQWDQNSVAFSASTVAFKGAGGAVASCTPSLALIGVGKCG